MPKTSAWWADRPRVGRRTLTDYVGSNYASSSSVDELSARLDLALNHVSALSTEVDGLRNDIRGLHVAVLVLVTWCVIFGVAAIFLIG